jgi:flagellar hook-associated protein 2
MASTNSVSGLSSGFDWQTMIDGLIEVDKAPIKSLETQKTTYQDQLTAWQSFNTTLLSLKTAAEGLSAPDDFNLYTSSMTSDNSDVDAENLLSISASSTASPGSYSIQVNNIATAQKLSSSSLSSYSDALGSDFAGDIIINGTVITISATDGLDDIKNRINNANSGDNATGVTASVIAYGSNDYRLILTSDNTGAEGINLRNGSANDLLELFGFKDGTSTLKNSITGGMQSDALSSSTQAIKSLLGLSTTLSGTIQVGGQGVALDLSGDSLESIKTKLNGLGISASILTNTDDGETTYTLQISGTQAYTDSQNILETLGIVTNGVSDVKGTASGSEMTLNGEPITSSTLLSDIDGYGPYTSGDHIDISGTDHNGTTIPGLQFDIEENSTVQDLMDAVKSAFGDNVSVQVRSDGRIEVDDLLAGTSAISVGLTSTVTDGSLDWGDFSGVSTIRKREIVAGQDASITIDGVEVTSSDNSLEDVIAGVTLNIRKADGTTTINLKIERDVSGIMKNAQTFVDAYNKVASYISQQQAYDKENKTPGGVLFGDGTLSSIKSDLTSILVNPVRGVSSDLSTLGLAGINIDDKGQLSIDSDTLEGYLKANFSDIQKLFAADGTSDSSSIEYVYSTKDTQSGNFAVNITQAATRNTSTSDTAVSGTLTTAETLTLIDGGNNTATISLASGMTISAIVNAVNSELDASYTEILAGSEEVTTVSSSPVTSSTVWSDIEGAVLVNDDTISFTGTDRSGNTISGSYTIDDTTTDTIQGLLSQMESAFDDEASASIDSSGRIIITDNSDGISSLSLTFNATGSAIFGTLSTSNNGGREGRYAMGITASSDTSGHLVLTNDNYGSGNSFTIEENTDSGLWSGSMSAPVTVSIGKDVAGTINGEAATGKGQMLTGDDGDANIDGLSIKYTGATTGNVGNLKFTIGVATLFDRALFNITDSYDGYLSFKKDSLSDNISDIKDRIEQMNERLDKRKEVMTARFTAMELMLSKLQNMSSWLTSQLNAAASGWK